MEIGKSQIARLVLGYLKSENCPNAFNEFLTTSQYLKQHAPFVKNGKYFATRVGGLTLEDIINQYAEMSSIIQGKLEQTNYYEEHHDMNLIDQLMYIFDNNCQVEGSSISSIINTTPSELLPGNSSSPNTCNLDKLTKSTPEENNFIDTDDEQQIENISQILLDKSVHEKLADVINAVNPLEGQNMLTENASKELDEKINTIVQKAEQDPRFNQILDEIMGTTPIPHTIKNLNNLNNSKIKNNEKEKVTENTQKEDIIKNSNEISKNVTNIHVSTSQVRVSPEVTVFNGNLDNYVNQSGALLTQPTQSQIFVSNTPGLIMLPPVANIPNYFILNNQKAIPSTVLTDTDIMKMPTVILDDRLSTPINEETTKSSKPKPLLAPKTKDITISTSDGDYLAVYKDDGKVHVTTEIVDVISTAVQKHVSNIPKKETKITKQRRNSGFLKKKLSRQCKTKRSQTLEREKHKSPSTPNLKTNSAKATPKSGSHVRTLDFASPPKEIEKKVDTEMGSAKKNVTKTLFEKNNSQKKKRRGKEWDSDMRELLVLNKLPCNSSFSSDDMDITGEDQEELKNTANLIEAAIKTPLKESIQTIQNKSIDKQETELSVQFTEKNKENDILKKGNSSEVGEHFENFKEDIDTVTLEESAVYLRNCNAPPRFKKKCNTNNDLLQKCQVEVVIERNEKLENLVQTQVSEETKKQHENSSSSTNVRNIILETPVKFPPPTPGKNELTPFSLALEEHLKGMDLLTLPSPALPIITPLCPVTPAITLNTPIHTNRLTDYSTSSSYYQPSDTEQNKSLEHLIEECRRIENDDAQIKSSEKIGIVKPITNINEMKKLFNENAMGKKNLNLIKSRDLSSSSDDSNFSSNSDDSENSDSESNDRVQRKGTYCLRNRVVTPKPEIKLMSLKTPKTEPVIRKTNPLKAIKSDSDILLSSVIDKSNGKNITKIMKKKVLIPSKKNTQKNDKKLPDIENEVTDDEITLHLSTDEETLHKSSIENVEGTSIEVKQEKECHDEAEQLIQGLKERGIHLVHKKSPKKSSDLSENDNNEFTQTKKCKEETKYISKCKELENEKNEVEITSRNVEEYDNDNDLNFDILCIEEENFKFEHDYSKKKLKKKTLDLSILGKKMLTSVYVEILEKEIERQIEVTPYQEFFDYIPTKIKKTRKKKEPTESARKLQMKDEKSSNKKEQSKYLKVKIPPKKSLTAKEKLQTNNPHKLDNSPKTKNVDVNSEIIMNKSKVSNKQKQTPNSPILNGSDDELMNYAVIGSQREENSRSPKSGEKRKCIPIEDEPTGKKYKTEQALLQKVNLDVFLNKVHGSSENS